MKVSRVPKELGTLDYSRKGSRALKSGFAPFYVLSVVTIMSIISTNRMKKITTTDNMVQK